MKALGQGSIASVLQVALQVGEVLLWIAAGLLGLGALIYFGWLAGLAVGLLPEPVVPSDEVWGGPVPLARRIEWDPKLIVPSMALGAIMIGCSLTIVSRMRRLFANLTADKVFSRDNAAHVQTVWITLVVLEVARWIIAGVMWALIEAGVVNGIEIDLATLPKISVSTVAAILILMVLAEVFRVGARLREDQDLTI